MCRRSQGSIPSAGVHLLAHTAASFRTSSSERGGFAFFTTQ